MNNQQAFAQARQVIPGGVNSPVRAFGAVGGEPVFITAAKGAYVTDIEGKSYIDYVGSWGPMILGHADCRVQSAVAEQLAKGLSYGAPTLLETELAVEIQKLMPSLEQLRFVNSGTEATMSAIRLARGFTRRDKIIKFEGCYHGHSDGLLVKAGSGALTFGQPSSPGIPADITKHTLNVTFNDSEQLKHCFAEHGDQLAAVILEPVAGNMNLIPAQPDFLSTIRQLCDQHKVVLIFDEVMSGFRVALGGAQAHYGITPDLTTLGKVIGGGMPVGAFGGRREIMQHLSPAGGVYQAGTLSGNPLAMAAGLAQLKAIQADGFYQALEKNTKRLVEGLNASAAKYDIAFHATHLGSMFGLFFTHTQPVTCFAQVMQAEIEQFKAFFQYMLTNGVYLAPSAFEAGFMSAAHQTSDIDQTITIATQFFADNENL